MRLLQPDQPINSTPYALVADLAHHATVANGVSANGITHAMLSEEVRADLNRTITLADLDQQVVAELNDSVAPGSITSNQLSEQILKYIRPEIIEVPELPDFRQQVYQGQEIVLKGDACDK